MLRLKLNYLINTGPWGQFNNIANAAYYQLDSKVQIHEIFKYKYNNFHDGKGFWQFHHLQNIGYCI